MIEIHLHHKGEIPPDGVFLSFSSLFAPEVGEEILVQKPDTSEPTTYVIRKRRVFIDQAIEEPEHVSLMVEVEAVKEPTSTSVRFAL